MRMPTPLPFGEGRVSGEASIPAPARSAGVVGTARWKGGSGNRQRSGPFRESCTVRRSLPSASTYYDKIHPRTSCDTPLARANAGAPGRDGMTFARIEASVAGGPARGTGFEDVPARSGAAGAALAMFLDGDVKALQAYHSGDRTGPIVMPYSSAWGWDLLLARKSQPGTDDRFLCSSGKEKGDA